MYENTVYYLSERNWLNESDVRVFQGVFFFKFNEISTE